MATDAAAPRSRRALLFGALGSIAALAANAIGYPEVIRAGSDGDVILGSTNAAGSLTEITASGSAFRAVGGSSGLIGWGDIGVDAVGMGIGVNAISQGAGPGAIGWTQGNSTGLLGMSTADTTQATNTAPPKTGVYGIAEQDSTARGVFGQTTAGQGVRGEATTGVGVQAVATTGMALAVSGRLGLSRAGRIAIPANKSSLDITVPGGLASNAMVFATLQTYRAGVSGDRGPTQLPRARHGADLPQQGRFDDELVHDRVVRHQLGEPRAGAPLLPGDEPQ